jgi:hypothetical protein
VAAVSVSENTSSNATAYGAAATDANGVTFSLTGTDA